MSTLKGLNINLTTLPRDTLYVLQDGITAELRTRESRAVQVLNEKKINMEQISLQCDKVVSQNQQLVQVIYATCQSISELAITADIPVEERIDRLAEGVCEAQEKMRKVQLEMNLHIADLQLKAQSCTPPEVREHCASAITVRVAEIGNAAQDCTSILGESFEVLKNLQEDSNIQHLEIDALELQKQYNSVRGTAQTMVVTQRLVWTQNAKALKEQLDASRHKEAVLKVRIQPWINEAFTITAEIEGKLAHMQWMHARMQRSTSHTEV